MKKGQVRMIFTWIFVLIVAGLILIYGVKVVRNTQKFSEDVVVVNFFKELKNKVDLYYSLDIGSIKKENFKLPAKIKYVCFTENSAIGTLPTDIQDKRSYLEGLREFDNVFLFPLVYEQSRTNIGSKLDLDKNPKCFSVSGGLLQIKLQTTEDGVNVTETT